MSGCPSDVRGGVQGLAVAALVSCDGFCPAALIASGTIAINIASARSEDIRLILILRLRFVRIKVSSIRLGRSIPRAQSSSIDGVLPIATGIIPLDKLPKKLEPQYHAPEHVRRIVVPSRSTRTVDV